MDKNLERQYNLDLLRIFACFMVIFLHIAAHKWRYVPIDSGWWQAFTIYSSMVRSCVPLFFMLSGKLFLSKTDFHFSKLYIKNILKLFLVYFLWSALYAIDTLTLSFFKDFDLNLFIATTLDSKYHLWFLPAQITVYMVFPLLFAAKDYRNGKILNYICLLFFIFTILKTTVTSFEIPNHLKTVLNRFTFDLDNYCGYFILGYIIDQNLDKLKKFRNLHCILLYVLSTSITIYLTFKYSFEKGTSISTYYGYFFITTFVSAIAIFLFFSRIPGHIVPAKYHEPLSKLSFYTFFIYLMHPFIRDHLESAFALTPVSFNAYLSVPAISAIIFLICLVFAIVIDKIPLIRKLLL